MSSLARRAASAAACCSDGGLAASSFVALQKATLRAAVLRDSAARRRRALLIAKPKLAWLEVVGSPPAGRKLKAVAQEKEQKSEASSVQAVQLPNACHAVLPCAPLAASQLLALIVYESGERG